MVAQPSRRRFIMFVIPKTIALTNLSKVVETLSIKIRDIIKRRVKASIIISVPVRNILDRNRLMAFRRRS